MDMKDEIEALRREVAELRELIEQPTAPEPFLGARCEIAQDVKIQQGCVLKTGDWSPIRVGRYTSIWQGAQWLGPITVGERVFVNQGSYIRPNVTIEDDVSIGPFVRIISDTHDISAGKRRTGTPRKDPIVIGAGTWIGAGATIMGGVTVGKRSIIATGAVVTKDIPDNVVAAGVPARVIRLIKDGEHGGELMELTGPTPENVGPAAS